MTIDQLQQQLKLRAAEKVAQYPQYSGHWEGWRVGQVTRRVKTKMGVAFEAGDLALVAPERQRYQTRGYVTAYSERNQIDTSIPESAVTLLG